MAGNPTKDHLTIEEQAKLMAASLPGALAEQAGKALAHTMGIAGQQVNKPYDGGLLTKLVSKQGTQSPLTAKLAARTKSTSDITNPWFRLLLHGEIDSRKTTTAATFGSPEQTRIILTRGEDQLLPLRKKGYKFLQTENALEFTHAAKYCEQIWPEWAAQKEPVLVLDDLSRAKDKVLEDNETFVTSSGEVKEHKDPRKMFAAALEDMAGVFNVINSKPMHIILVCTSRIRENVITGEESVFPDLPPSMANLIMSDYSFIFYINKKKPYSGCLLTGKDSETVTQYDDKQKKDVTFQRYYFARHKMAVEDEGKLLKLYEPLDLRSIWERVKG